jgi:hypothetical protein
MDAMAVISLMTGSGACAVRGLQVWLRGRTAVQLARISESGTKSRIKLLPPGSVLSEQRADRSRVTVRVGVAGSRTGDADE